MQWSGRALGGNSSVEGCKVQQGAPKHMVQCNVAPDSVAQGVCGTWSLRSWIDLY